MNPIQLLNGSITRVRLKKFKGTLNGMIQDLWNDIDKIQICNKEACIGLELNNINQHLVTLIQVKVTPAQYEIEPDCLDGP